jgi:transcription elongation factor Elf1
MRIVSLDGKASSHPDYDHELYCPRCGSEYLHQGTVTVYSRSEDADTVCRTVVGGGVNVDVSVERVPNDRANPSSRRQGLVISFRCENCSDEARSDLELCLAQHKGCTFAFWRFEGGP